ncbi:MAG: PIN domain-containing protein [Bacteroidota bacterium]
MTSATIFPDTTILIQYQALDRIDWRKVLGVKHVKLVLTTAMLQEIEDIKNQDISPTLARKAEASLRVINTLLDGSREMPAYLKIIQADAPELDFEREQLDPNSMADLLVATIIDYQRKQALEYVVLFSDDTETCEKADAAGIEIASLSRNFMTRANQPQAPQTPPPAKLQPQDTPPREKQSVSGLFATSTQKLANPTPLFKNKLIDNSSDAAPEHQPVSEAQDATAPEATEKEATEPPSLQTNKLFEVINPDEVPDAPVAAVEQPTVAEDAKPTEELDQPAIEINVPPPPPFVDIIQEPARPDHSTRDSYHPSGAPVKPKFSIDAIAGRKKTVPAKGSPDNPQAVPAGQPGPSDAKPLPPITSRIITPDAPAEVTPTTTSPDAPTRPTPSFSFTNISKGTHADSEASPPAPEPEPVDEKPELRLAFDGDEQRCGLIIHHPEYPSIDEVTETIAALRRNYPKLAMLGTSSGDGLGSTISGYDEPVAVGTEDVFFQRRNTRIKRYNSALESYYANSEKYLSEVAEFENFRRRSAQLDLMLINELPDSLKSLYIAIHFPSNLRVFSEDNLPEKPVGPTPPDEPNLDAIFDKIRLPGVPVPGEISTNSDIKMRSRNLAPMEVRWNKGWDVIYSMREIEKGEHIAFNPLYIVFNSFEHATSFKIQFRVTVASASYEERGSLEVLVRKEI